MCCFQVIVVTSDVHRTYSFSHLSNTLGFHQIFRLTHATVKTKINYDTMFDLILFRKNLSVSYAVITKTK